MKNSPGFLTKFYDDVYKLPADELSRVGRFGGLDLQDLVNFIAKPQDYTVDYPDNISADSLLKHCQIPNDITKIGQQSLDSAETVMVVYTSEFSDISCTKRLVMDMTLLGMKHIQSLGISNVWYVVPSSIYDEVESHFRSMSHSENVKLFKQFESVRLTPDNQLHVVNDQQQFHACGSGDSISCFIENGDLKSFIDRGGKHLYFVEMNNILAAPDSAILGQHIMSESPITAEVVSRLSNESGAVLCKFLGVEQIVEKFRLSTETEDDFNLISTGSFIVRADLNFKSMKLPWHRMKRKVANQLVLQYERFLSDITGFFKTNFIEVDRTDRYQPVRNSIDISKLEEQFELK